MCVLVSYSGAIAIHSTVAHVIVAFFFFVFCIFLVSSSKCDVNHNCYYYYLRKHNILVVNTQKGSIQPTQTHDTRNIICDDNIYLIFAWIKKDEIIETETKRKHWEWKSRKRKYENKRECRFGSFFFFSLALFSQYYLERVCVCVWWIS